MLAALLLRESPVSPQPEPGATPSPSIASVLAELSAFVEEARGLEFLDEVNLTVLSEPQFREELKKRAADPADTDRAEAVLTVLGLLPAETDGAALRAPSDQEADRVAVPDSDQRSTRARSRGGSRKERIRTRSPVRYLDVHF